MTSFRHSFSVETSTAAVTLVQNQNLRSKRDSVNKSSNIRFWGILTSIIVIALWIAFGLKINHNLIYQGIINKVLYLRLEKLFIGLKLIFQVFYCVMITFLLILISKKRIIDDDINSSEICSRITLRRILNECKRNRKQIVLAYVFYMDAT